MRRLAFAVTLLIAAAAVWYLWPRLARVGDAPATKTGAASKGATNGSVVAGAPSAAAGAKTDAPQLAADFPIAASLNAPDSTIARDLDVMRQIFETWQSNFPHEGNPVGENAEITAALLGENRLGLALIPKNHRALNDRGELCDRWGTPFRFHQLSGTRMEIRSAGPDRKFGSDDDVLWTPP